MVHRVVRSSCPPLLLLQLLIIMVMGMAMVRAEQEWRVGDSKGWVVGAVNYSLWAANHTFLVGDFLVFSYLKEFHSVLEVTKDNYEICNTTNPISQHKDGKTRLRLDKAMSFYFICGVYKHCPLGQKLEVSVLNPPPPPNSNKSVPVEAPPHNLQENKPPASTPLNSSPSSQICAHQLLLLSVIAMLVYVNSK